MSEILLRVGPEAFTTTAETVAELKQRIDTALEGDPWLDVTDRYGQPASIRLCSGVPLWIESRPAGS